MAELKQMAEAIANLTIKEAIELANILKDEYGIEPAAAAVAALPLLRQKALQQKLNRLNLMSYLFPPDRQNCKSSR